MGYREQFAEALKNYGQDTAPEMKQYEEQLNKPQVDPSTRASVGLIDDLYGTHTSERNLPKMESTKDRLAQLLQLKQGVQQQKLSGLGKLANMEANSQNQAAQRAFQQQMYDLQLAKARMKAQAPAKLGSEDKKALGYTQTLAEVLPKYREALKKSGEGLRPGMWTDLTGDTEATALRKQLVENYGRLQSGGAISGDEEKRFGSLFGGLMDSPEQVEKKLQQMEQEVGRKQGLYGGQNFATQGGRTPTAVPKGIPQGFDPMNASEADLDLFLAQHGG